MKIMMLVKRILLEFKRDKRTLALMFVAPLFIMSLLYLVFQNDEYKPSVAFVDVPAPIVQHAKSTNADIHEWSMPKAKSALADQELDAIVSFTDHKPEVWLEGSDPTANRAVLQLLQNVFQSAVGPAAVQPDIHYLHGGPSLSSFDRFGPVLLGFFVFFFVFLIAGVAFLRERTKGTLERLLSSPIRRTEIVVGYVIGFGLFAMMQTAVFVAYTVYVLDLWMAGSVGYVFLINLLLALTALSLGILLSAAARNELQMIQFIPLVIVPQVFFSGLFELETISDWVSWIGYFTPLFYGADALRGVMLRDASFGDIGLDLAVLLGYALLFMILNIVALKRLRRL
ncbi:MAG TPA: ABC transporter permease [Bacillales bacterium]|nr:ABC transporter permease [Bacillales bacterium]